MGDTNLIYVLGAVFFIYGLKMLSHPRTARRGNIVAAVGMLIVIVATLVVGRALSFQYVAVGIIIGAIIGGIASQKVKMTAMPQMVGIFNGFGGGASALVAIVEFYSKYHVHPSTYLISTVAFSVLVGTLTFTGSFVAFGKLQGFIKGQPVLYFGQKTLNALAAIAMVVAAVCMALFPAHALLYFVIVILLSALLGITLVIPIGGADMPVVISLLNSYSGIAAVGAGFVLLNQALIITGALVGASGIILTNIMCKGMNRSIWNVIFGGFGGEVEVSGDSAQKMNIKSYSTEEAALLFDAAEKIVIVPGYGLAVAQAQHAVRELADFLEEQGKTVLYGIHPVAGRMPGHMNVLLAEADVPYEKLKDLDEINSEIEDADVALVLGANDVVNPSARHDKSCPIYGMPIINVDRARAVIINKRSMNTGFSGIQNELFGYDNAFMVFGDAKDMLSKLLTDLREL